MKMREAAAAAIGGLLRLFRPALVRLPSLRRCPMGRQPLATEVLVETAVRQILLVSREKHDVAALLDVYGEFFETGVAANATWAHVCTASGKAPLLVYSRPAHAEGTQRPAWRHSSSTRACTSGLMRTTSGHGRANPSWGHLRVASTPILDP